MELTKISTIIQSKISQLSENQKELKIRAEKRAESISNYEKQLALTIIKLKNGVDFYLEEENIKSPPATLTEKIARGICYIEKLEVEKQEAFYKNLIITINILQAQLNSYQTLVKFQNEI